MIDRADGRNLRAGFLRSAARWPERPAVVVRGATRTYAQLEEAARLWAGALVSHAERVPERIGIFAYRSEVAYAGTLAALFAGATFVPLNPTFPPEKTRAMAASADLDAVIVDKTCTPQVEAALAGVKCPLLLLPEAPAPVAFSEIAGKVLCAAQLAQAKPLTTLPPLVPEDVAYLLYTSGSTGAPKGVPVTHGNAMHFMEVMSERYQLTPEDRLSQSFDQTFDLSVFDLFMTWLNGAVLYSITPVELLAPVRFMERNGITVWFSVPSVATQMKRRGTLLPDTMPSLRYSLFCGEALHADVTADWQLAAPNSIVENLYGPTELTIACFVHRWSGESSAQSAVNGIVPIGRPYPGLAAVLVDERLHPVPEGTPGELCVSGPQTSPGYWKDPERTAERFVMLDVAGSPRRFYRTGDLVTRLKNGEYAYLGRTDQQIKVLGHRVELGEIEAVLRKGKGMEHAIAFGWPLQATTATGIVAVVSGNQVDVNELTRLAQAELPPYMVPKKIDVLEAMPLNANGKVDRPALRKRLQIEEEKAACSAIS